VSSGLKPRYDGWMSSDDGATDDTIATDSAALAATALAAPGYRMGDVIGRGGMGEVVLAEDTRIGRPVAIKRMRGELASDDLTARFLREARIQARLEHPAVVPVHELGHDSEGRPYFTMKRLAGTTLEQVLAAGTTSTNELLRALVDVCLAIDFAHARGVVHRDIKPSNIMLGDYGEVYVLDWGVARLIGERDLGARASGPIDEAATQAGAVLGTPAYMAPEQLSGDAAGPATDAYALGAVLFEVLAGEQLHPRTAEVSPAVRRPERAIAPELDALCTAALAQTAASRPTARELADRLRRYLDGDRDLARRRTLATELLDEARATIASGDPARRAAAMAAAGRALALDPSSSDAAGLVTQLMLEPPRELPAGLARRLADKDVQIGREQGRLSAANIAAYFMLALLVVWVGVRDWTVIGATWAVALVTMLGCIALARGRIHGIGFAVLGNTITLTLGCRSFGPFILMPTLIANSALSMITFPAMLRRPWLVLGAALAAFAVPLLLEAVGFWEPTWWLADGNVVTHPVAIAIEGFSGTFVVVVCSAAAIVVTAMYVRTLALSQRAAQRQLDIQAWHLEQLLPARPC